MNQLLEEQLPKSPPALVNRGCFNLGVFGTPFATVNFGDVQPHPRRRLIEFQHFALGNGRFHVSVALFDTKRIGQAQVSIYDRETKQKYRYERKTLSRELTLASTVLEGESSFRRGKFLIRFENGAATGTHRLEFSCPASGSLPEVAGSFICYESIDSSPCVVCLPFDDATAMYSHKGIIPAEGSLRINGDTFEFPRHASYAMTDFHKGFYPNPLKWNWAAGAGFDVEGRLYGFNLTRNQAVEPNRYNENWLYVADHSGVRGEMERLPLAEFTVANSDVIGKPWHIRDKEGRVDVQFIPEVSHSIDLNILVTATRYRGPYGRFEGHIVNQAGHMIDVTRCFGMAEDFYLRG